MNDIYFHHDNKCFNLRVSGIVRKDNKVLFYKTIADDHYSLPGGRVRFGETTEQSIVREIKEKLNIDANVVKLLSINENFFDYANDEYHEILFVYQCELKNDIHEDSESDKEIKWMNVSGLSKYNIKPESLIDCIKQLPENIEHNIKR